MSSNTNDMSTRADWLFPVLKSIRLRPRMYLRDERLFSLSNYLEGVIYGLKCAGVTKTDGEEFLVSFGKWMGQKIDSRNGDCWFYLEHLPDGSGGVAKFYRELDRYLIDLGYENGLETTSLSIDNWALREK